MLKDPEISRHSSSRTHRTYTPEFKAQLVAACQVHAASVAALALHGMNANVLHRWLKEHQRSGCHASAAQRAPGIAPASPAFIPLALPAPTAISREQEIKVELRKGPLSMVVTWPVSATADLASWTAAILK